WVSDSVTQQSMARWVANLTYEPYLSTQINYQLIINKKTQLMIKKMFLNSNAGKKEKSPCQH
ncbi:MAG: hypothetical protein ACXW1U_21705, partial [Methylobacter sp.]